MCDVCGGGRAGRGLRLVALLFRCRCAFLSHSADVCHDGHSWRHSRKAAAIRFSL